MIMNQILGTLLLLSVNAQIAFSQPAAGNDAPDFSLPSLRGGMLRLATVNKTSLVVLIALRGFPGYQCPFCNRQVEDFVRKADAFAAASARVIIVYPGALERAKEFAADKKLPVGFDLVVDQDYAFTNRYGLRWEGPGETAYPATFVIKRGGVISFAEVSNSHGGRTTAAEIVQLLTKGLVR
jgi:peroxiredoxin